LIILTKMIFDAVNIEDSWYYHYVDKKLKKYIKEISDRLSNNFEMNVEIERTDEFYLATLKTHINSIRASIIEFVKLRDV